MAIVDINASYVAATGENNDSRKTMVYTSDNGTTLYTVDISENIGEAMGFADFTSSTVASPLPRGYQMRTVTFSDASGKVKGTYPVGAPTTSIYVEGGTITVARKGKADGILCQVTGSQGEKKRFAAANDTGQQSGDNS